MWLLADNPSYSSKLIIPFFKEWTQGSWLVLWSFPDFVMGGGL